MAAAICGDGPPGVYNLAGEGEVQVSDIARELGWRSVPVPGPALSVGTAVARRLKCVSWKLEWVITADTPGLMDTTKARCEQGGRPRFDIAEMLRQTVAGAREMGVLD